MQIVFWQGWATIY